MSSTVPLEALVAWARLNYVELRDTKVENVPGKGLGLFTTQPRLGDGDEVKAGSLIEIPRDLILSAEAVEDYAKVNRDFRQLLDKVGPQSSRMKILLYLLVHLRHSARDQAQAREAASTPWTDYIKFLPKDVPLPTLWTKEERELLAGTSLEGPLNAKLASLVKEFDDVRRHSSDLPFWHAYLWENEEAQVEDWALLDAWYRSRCLELPRAGLSMVPCLDLANHSEEPNAFYDETSGGDAALLPRPGCATGAGDEICISYGGSKSAAEMLFSYGFVDDKSISSEMTLPLEASLDDPLAQAKVHAYEGSPAVRLSRTEGSVVWHSPFVHLAILNEEDGLEFRVQQDRWGDRQLRVFWQEQDVTSQATQFERLTQDHPLRSIFRLRAVAILQERIVEQLERIQEDPIAENRGTLPPGGSPGPRADCVAAVELLREKETSLLKDAVASLEDQKSILLEDATVQVYLGLTEDTQNEQTSPQSTNEEPDFS